jgi:hypothetical protein
VISIWLPSGRGDELQVDTTVAQATLSPSASHARATSSTDSRSLDGTELARGESFTRGILC